MPRKPRNLHPQERALWEYVTRKTARLGTVSRVEPERQLSVKPVSNPPKMSQYSNPAPRITSAGAEKPAVAMDYKAFRKMKSGRLSPEARIDLHGLTLAQAQPRLTRFIQDSADRGNRLVLVITGKGRPGIDDGPIPVRPGALRHQVPHWLHSMPLKPLVLQISEASRKHGGQGAYYVYLRRRRG